MATNTMATFIVSILFVTLSVLSIIGLYWLTDFSFGAESLAGSNLYCVKRYSRTKLGFARLTVVLIWIQIAVSIVAVLWAASRLNS
jgi:hypothetical protein